jgi:hypothetical protein
MAAKGLGLRCCESCQIYWTCETKWFWGEQKQENICCDKCNLYTECLQKTNANKPSP